MIALALALLAPQSPTAPVQTDKVVAIQLEIIDAQEQTLLSSSHHITPVGSMLSVDQAFTVRPLRKQRRLLSLELTPIQTAAGGCTVAVRSRVAEEPELLLVGPAREVAVGGTQWAQLMSNGMLEVRARCLPLDELLLESQDAPS